MTRQSPRPSDYDFENSLSFEQANDLLITALDQALSAMAAYGSDELHMTTLSLLRVVALKEQHAALSAQQKERKS